MKPHLVILFILVVLGTETAVAHKLQVATLRIVETGEMSYAFSYTVPLGMAADYPPPRLPEHAEYPAKPGLAEGRQMLEFATTGRPLAAGDIITLDWNRNGVMASMIWLNGTRSSTYFPKGNDGIQVELAELRAGSGTWYRSAARYIPLGFEHIIKGLDHLFFVAGLLLLVRGLKPLILTITAFTLAHSLTLALSLFGIFRLSSNVVEVIVALSIIFLAVEIVYNQQGRATLAANYPWAVSFFFGLVHGLGFAGALESMGLANESITLVLLFFNIGVELGQLAFVAVCLITALSCRRLAIDLPQPLAKATAYALGTTASIWFLLRIGIVS